MAQVNRQIDRVGPINIRNRTVILHIHRNEFITDFGRVFRRIRQTKLRALHLRLDVGVFGEVDLVGLDTFGPPDMV